MSRTSRSSSLVLVAGLFAGLVAPGAPRSARAAGEALPTDPGLVRGTLDNGLRYVVRRHGHPPGRAVVWLHVHSGSLNETDRQHGIAHFLEHMAFNGSEHFPPGSLVPFFQSMGMTFGRDQNAFTNLEQTTYQLSLPDAKPETVAKAMTWMADVLGGLLLLPKEIDAERQIIQEERRRGLSGRQRVRDQIRARIAPGALWARRDTIGTEASIDGFTPQDFRDYYGAWYAPSNATVLVIADADPAEMVKAVGAAFGPAKARTCPAPADGGVKAYETSFAVVATDPEIKAEEVRITRLGPVGAPSTTVEAYRAELALDLGVAAWNRRLEDRIAAGGSSLVRARAEAGDAGRVYRGWEVGGDAAPGAWKAALEELALELQRARRHGFTERELADVKKGWLAGAERDVETLATTTATDLMRRLNGTLSAEEPLLAPEQRLALLRRLLPELKPAEVSARFAAELDPKAVAFVATLPAGPSVPTEAALLELGTKALAVEPPALAEAARATTLLATPPAAGAVKEGEEHAATGVWSGWLANGVRVHHRLVEAPRNEVTVQIDLVGGELLETAENRGVTSAALVAWRTPATARLSSSDVRELMSGKKIAVRAGGAAGGGGRRGRGGGGGGGAGPGAATLTVAGSPDDLETGLTLAYLLLTEPRVEPAAFAASQSTGREAYAEASGNPMALGMRLVGSLPFPDTDPRLAPATPEQLGRLTRDAAQAWLDGLVRTAPVEVTIVGDLPRDRALALAARWLGALPARERVSAETYRAQRTVARPAGPRRVERTLDTPTPQAFVWSGFYGADETDRPTVRALALAAQVLSTRMTKEVREQAQLVYSIGAASRPASVYPGFGTLAAGAPTEPHKVPALVAKLSAMYEAFAASGPSDDELAVAKKQVATTFEEQTKDPGYWLARIALSTFRGIRLDDVAADPAAYQAVTAAQVREVFARHATKDRALLVVVSPAAGAAAGKETPPAK
ncbi:MAG: insulinase family protein [Planctomycetota bacterium]